jgi:hypothetical protein
MRHLLPCTYIMLLAWVCSSVNRFALNSAVLCLCCIGVSTCSNCLLPCLHLLGCHHVFTLTILVPFHLYSLASKRLAAF